MYEGMPCQAETVKDCQLAIIATTREANNRHGIHRVSFFFLLLEYTSYSPLLLYAVQAVISLLHIMILCVLMYFTRKIQHFTGPR